MIDGKRFVEESGEVQLTDYGISGIPVFQVSRFATKALKKKQAVTAQIDFLPRLNEQETEQLFESRFREYAHGKTADEAMVGLLNHKLSGVLLKEAHIPQKKPADEVSKEDQEFMILESRFLEKPAFAVEQGRNAARHMEKDSRKALNIALDLIYDYSEEQAEHVQEIESKVDRYEDELGTYLVKLNNKDLSEKDSHSVSIMLHCIGDFERISDHAVNIMESARALHEKNLSFSPEARTELQVLASVVGRIVDTAYDVFDKQDMNLTRDVEPLEEMVDELSREMKRRHVNRLRSGECTIEMGFILTDLLTSLERIADHCSNISVCVTQVRENLYDTHSHLESLKNEPDEGYYNRLEELQREYVLP